MNSKSQTRGILIDPHAQTIKEVFVDSDDTLTEMRKLIECQYVTVVSLGQAKGQPQDLWIDDEGVLCDWDTQAFFRVRGMPDPLAGRGVIFSSSDDGDTISTRLDVDVLTSLIEWIEPRNVSVPAPRMITFNADGTETVTLLAKVETWTHANQP